MEGPVPALPLPVALLRRRSINAKTAKDRHDAACFAWEVSVKLGVAATPPADPTPLARGSFSQWAESLAGQDRPWESREMLHLYALLAEAGLGRRELPQSLPARRVLHAFEAYRVRVLWSGEPKPARFLDRSAGILRDALDQAWRHGYFIAQQHARLLYVESVETDSGGHRRAKIYDLHSDTPMLVDPRGTAVPPGIESGRLYLSGVGGWRTLHPYVLYVPGDERAHAYVLNGFWRDHAEYLDYTTGEALRGEDVERSFPGLTGRLASLFAKSGRAREPVVRPAPGAAGFGDYHLLGELGRGGMGVVLLARQKSLGRLVALKRLPRDHVDDPVMVGRFRREVAALGRCEHPNVVKILASGTDGGVPYYTMEFVQGADLAAISVPLAKSGDLVEAVAVASEDARRASEVLKAHVAPPSAEGAQPVDRYRHAARLFADAARGVHHLHEHGILHRDLKPGNVMVTADGQRAVIMDLGLAAVEDATTTLTRGEGEILGTLRYIAPELLQRHLFHVDRRADVYSLGATLFELVTDRPIFDGDSAPQLIEQVLREDPPPPEKANPDVPRDLSIIVRKAIEKDPALRYDNALELARDLEAFVEGRPIAARPPSLGYVFRLAVQRNRALTATVAAALLVVIVGTGFFIAHLRRTSEREAGLRADAERDRAQAEELVGFMLTDLRGRLRDAGRLDLLDAVARKAKEYYDRLPPGRVSDDTRVRRAIALAELGVILQNGADVAAAVESFRGSLAEARAIDDADPRAAGLRFAALRLLGDALRTTGDVDDARAAYEEAFALAEQQDRTQREWMRNLAVAHDRLGRSEAAFELYKDLANRDPDDGWALYHLTGSYESRGHELLERGRPQDALDCFLRAQSICQRLVAKDPGNLAWREILMASELKIGDALRGLGNADRAVASFRSALETARELSRAAPGNFAHRRSIALLQERIGDVLRQRGEHDEALASYHDALVLRAAQVEHDAKNRVTLHELANSHRHVARCLNEADRSEEARPHVDKAVAIGRRLVAADAGYTRWRILLSECLTVRADVLEARGDEEAAAADRTEARKLRETARGR